MGTEVPRGLLGSWRQPEDPTAQGCVSVYVGGVWARGPYRTFQLWLMVSASRSSSLSSGAAPEQMANAGCLHVPLQTRSRNTQVRQHRGPPKSLKVKTTLGSEIVPQRLGRNPDALRAIGQELGSVRVTTAAPPGPEPPRLPPGLADGP